MKSPSASVTLTSSVPVSGDGLGVLDCVELESPEPLQPARPSAASAIIHDERRAARVRFDNVSMRNLPDEVTALGDCNAVRRSAVDALWNLRGRMGVSLVIWLSAGRMR